MRIVWHTTDTDGGRLSCGHRYEAPLNSSSQMILFREETHPAEARRSRWLRRCCSAAPASMGHPPWGELPWAHPGESGLKAVASRWFTRARPPDAAQRSAVDPLASLSARQQRAESRVPYGRIHDIRYLVLQANSSGPPVGGVSTSGGRVAAWRRASGAPGTPAAELVAKAPAWLFSSESDRGGRAHATFWGAQPPPAAVVHFVCSSWPGSDGRRAAMRMWGRWFAQDVRAEAEPAGQALLDARSAHFVAFASPVDATSPATLMPYLRLLTLAAHATGRTPALPAARCDDPEQQWVDPSIDVATGLP